jgi:membrane-associated phospholipid phosphatase
MPRQLIKHHRYFLTVFAVYIILGAFSFLFYRQGSETLFFDTCHCGFWDMFFALTTQIVEAGLLYIGLALLIWGVRYFIVYVTDLLVLGAVVHFLKHQVFANHVRPSLFFGKSQALHFVAGVPILTDFSFPSGHTAAAFCIAFLLAIFIRRTWASMVFLALALLIGISRMYLLEHFWIDVYFGSLIGFTVTFLVYIALQKPVMQSESKFLNFSLYERYIKRK